MNSKKSSWTVNKRILLLTAVATSITLIISVISIYSLNSVNSSEKRMVELHLSNWGTGAALEQAVRKAGYEYQEYRLTGDDAFFETAISRFKKINGEIGELVDYSQRFDVPILDQQLIGLQEASDRFRADLEEYYRLSKLPEANEAALNEANKNVKAVYNDLLVRSADINESAEDGARNLAAETSAFTTLFSWIAGVSGVIAVLLTSLIGFYTGSSISNILKNLIGRLRGGSEQVNSSSEMLSVSSQELAESSSEQAASLEETTSSLEEMSSQIKHTAENSQQAEVAVKETRSLVEAGVSSMQKVTAAMEEIKNSSQETSKIIKTINDIAFQTNLLALNAAVEAARAGEAGKGFAVVAEEVRNLAQRSAEAANNTAELISRSQVSSESGAEVALEASENLKLIEENAGGVGTLIVEISAASREQAVGIDQMTSAISQMDNVVQGNAAASEESASSAEELSSQAEELNRIVNELSRLVDSDTETSMKPSFSKPRPRKILHSMNFQSQKNGHSVPKHNTTKREEPALDVSDIHIPLDDDDFGDF